MSQDRPLGPSRQGEPVALSTGKKVVFATVLLGLVGIGGCLLVELGLFVFGYQIPGFYDASGELVRTRSTTGPQGGAFPPGAGQLVHFDYDVPYVVNTHGFRERQLEAKRLGERRIGLFGDSHIAGYGVLPKERFGDLWIAARRAQEPAAQLWNFGAPSTGTHHMADVLGGVASEYGLDEIVLAISSVNELPDNTRWERQSQEGDAAQAARPSLTALLRQHSRLALLVWFHTAHGLFSRAPVLDPADGLEQAWPATERALDRFVANVRGRPFQLWFLPATTEWSDETFARSGLSDELRHSLRDRIGAWADRQGVPFVDATPWLAGHREGEVKFSIDGHYHAGGHRLIAQGLIARGFGGEAQALGSGGDD